MSGRAGETRVMWSSEPGESHGQPGPGFPDGRDGRGGRGGWPPVNGGAPSWNGASGPNLPNGAPPLAAQARTAPRLGATPPPPSPARAPDPPPDGMRDTNKRTKVTDSARMPALRLNRRERGQRQVEARPAMVYDTQRAPGYLRIVRLAVGLAALAGAWGVALVVASLAQALWMVAPHQPVLTERYAFYLVSAVGLLWLAVIGLAMIVVGAFSLFLALGRQGW